MEFTAALFQAAKKPKLSLPTLTTLTSLNPFPRRPRSTGRRRTGRQKLRADDDDEYDGDDAYGYGYGGSSGGGAAPEDVTRLQTSFNPLRSVRALRRHRWRLLDLQYPVLAFFVLFSLAIAPPAPVVKSLAVLGGILLLLMPVTRQFFLPSLPIWTYLLYFFTSRFIGVEYRPHIWVRVLPALENVLYGANLSNILSAHTHPVLDIVAWIPYGIGHFVAPAAVSAVLFLRAAPTTVPVFASCFGWLNILGVTTQLVFPCTPPWYENEHGLAPAAYGMPGSPAGLARVDAILGVDMYTTSFSTAPVPFGAFPSLHAADAVLEALFLSYCFPRLRPLFVGYVCWIWWATMYLSHHYAVDLVGGSLLSAAFFFVARARFLPRPQAGRRTRWEYDYVEVGEKYAPGLGGGAAAADEEMGGGGYGYGLGLLRRQPGVGDSDEWTIGSSSGASFSSSSRSSTSGGSASGSTSPSLPIEEGGAAARQQGMFVVEMTPHGQMWEGGVVGRESELSEVVVVR